MGKGFGRKNNIHISREIPAKRINENSHGDAHFKFESSTAITKIVLPKKTMSCSEDLLSATTIHFQVAIICD
jgi:hypothetical protein